MNFDEAPEFRKDVKRLQKRWRSIPNDIERLKVVIQRLYIPTDGVNMTEFREQMFATPRANIMSSNQTHEVVKMRLDCTSLGNDKKTRVVFVAIKTKDAVILVELYAKNEKDSEDKKRLARYL